MNLDAFALSDKQLDEVFRLRMAIDEVRQAQHRRSVQIERAANAEVPRSLIAALLGVSRATTYRMQTQQQRLF